MTKEIDKGEGYDVGYDCRVPDPKLIYLICSVRHASASATAEAERYVAHMEFFGHTIMWPSRDVEQDDPTGVGIVDTEIQMIKDCDEVHILWDKNSKGSHFDLGVALALDKRLVFVNSVRPDDEGKSYQKVILAKILKQKP
jgi:nucleoside 2-deoxyribosyltransferase